MYVKVLSLKTAKQEVIAEYQFVSDVCFFAD